MKDDKDWLGVTCPYCREGVYFSLEYAFNNDRVCCMHCNKAFEFDLKTLDDKDSKFLEDSDFFGFED